MSNTKMNRSNNWCKQKQLFIFLFFSFTIHQRKWWVIPLCKRNTIGWVMCKTRGTEENVNWFECDVLAATTTTTITAPTYWTENNDIGLHWTIRRGTFCSCQRLIYLLLLFLILHILENSLGPHSLYTEIISINKTLRWTFSL